MHLYGLQPLHHHVHALPNEVVVRLHMGPDQRLELLGDVVPRGLPLEHQGGLLPCTAGLFAGKGRLSSEPRWWLRLES